MPIISKLVDRFSAYSPRAKSLVLWSIFAIFYLLLYGYRLHFPAFEYYDEIDMVDIARHLPSFRHTIGNAHPPLAMYLMTVCIQILGDHPWVWRLPSLFSGLGIVTLVYLIVEKLSQNKRAAFFAAFLLFFDGISFTLARIAMLNAVMHVFMLASIYSLILHTITGVWSRRRSFFWTGVFFGLAVGTRWVALSLIFIFPLFLALAWEKSQDKKTLIWDILTYLVLLPITVYFSIFLTIPFIKGYHGWKDIFRYNWGMVRFHLTLDEWHKYTSRWWTWPLMLRPIVFYFQEQSYVSLLAHQNVTTIACIGNPAIVWLSLPVLVLAIYKWLKNKSFILGFLIVGFLSQWLPWAFLNRLQWFHYWQTVMPYVTLGLGLALDHYWKKNVAGRWLVGLYLTFVVGMFIYWYPLLSGLTVDTAFFRTHLWLKSWF